MLINGVICPLICLNVFSPFGVSARFFSLYEISFFVSRFSKFLYSARSFFGARFIFRAI